jgi:threonine dehydrogenase-like Zn-dependent dehydrogenase
MTKMLAGQILGPRQLAIVEVPIPEIDDGQILIKVEAGAICGSDVPYFFCDSSYLTVAAHPIPFPPGLSLHELVGRVAQTGSERFKEGDRVLALPEKPHAGLAQYFVSTGDLAVPIPNGPAEQLVVSQPLGTVVHACLKLPNLLGLTAVVMGQGPTGQLFTALLRRMGVRQLIAVDLLPERLRVSTSMGATHILSGGPGEILESVKAITNGTGADLAIEATGKVEVLNVVAQLVKRNGTVLVFGVPPMHGYDFALHDFFWNEGRLITSVGPNVQHDFPIAVDLISSGAIDVTPLLTHRFPFSRAQEAFTLFADRAQGAIKVVLTAE